MNKIIAIALKVSGAGWVWKTIDGYKTKISSTALILSGASMMLAGSAEILMSVSVCANMACTIGIIRGISANPNAITIAQGFIVFNAGLAGLGIGHKMEKAQSIPPVPPVQ